MLYESGAITRQNPRESSSCVKRSHVPGTVNNLLLLTKAKRGIGSQLCLAKSLSALGISPAEH